MLNLCDATRARAAAQVFEHAARAHAERCSDHSWGTNLASAKTVCVLYALGKSALLSLYFPLNNYGTTNTQLTMFILR